MPPYYRPCALIAGVLFLIALILAMLSATPAAAPLSALGITALAGVILCAGLLL